MNDIKMGIIGTGGIVVRGHAAAVSATPGLQLWSFLSRDRTRASEFAKRFGARAPQPDHSQLATFLADPELDAVIIATPDRLHAAQTIAAAKAGKHIFLEKPMATSLAEVEAIQRAVRDHDVRLGLSYRLRWHQGHRDIVCKIRNGDFGIIRHVRVLWAEHAQNAENWRAKNELGRWWSLAALGTHGLDLIRWVLDENHGEAELFRSVITRKVWSGPHDETALLTMAFEAGPTAELCSSYLFAAPTRLEIYGTEGFAIGEGTFGREGGGRIWTHEGPFPFESRNPFVGMLTDFASAIRACKRPEVDELEGGRNIALLLAAIDEAAE